MEKMDLTRATCYGTAFWLEMILSEKHCLCLFACSKWKIYIAVRVEYIMMCTIPFHHEAIMYFSEDF